MTEAMERLAEGRKHLVELGKNLQFMYHPAGFRHEPVSRLSGQIDFHAQTIRAPHPRTRKAIFIYLYLSVLATIPREQASAVLTARRRAVEIMRGEGLAVPRGMQCWARGARPSTD